ncbi:MAG: hypothetical protein ACKOYJ_10465 [Planctomycetia bacterium]
MSSTPSVEEIVRKACLLAAALLAPPEERTIHGQPSWIIATDDVELAITKRGGHMAPVTFDRKAGTPIALDAARPTEIRYTQGAVRVPGRHAFVMGQGTRP